MKTLQTPSIQKALQNEIEGMRFFVIARSPGKKSEINIYKTLQKSSLHKISKQNILLHGEKVNCRVPELVKVAQKNSRLSIHVCVCKRTLLRLALVKVKLGNG